MEPPVLYKTLTYSTFDRSKYSDMAKTLAYQTPQKIRTLLPQFEDNRNRPSEVEKCLNELAYDGWEVLWAFNTEFRIELLLYKVVGELSPREIQAEKEREIQRRHLDRGFNWW
jgi:hypothetical protein